MDQQAPLMEHETRRPSNGGYRPRRSDLSLKTRPGRRLETVRADRFRRDTQGLWLWYIIGTSIPSKKSTYSQVLAHVAVSRDYYSHGNPPLRNPTCKSYGSTLLDYNMQLIPRFWTC